MKESEDLKSSLLAGIEGLDPVLASHGLEFSLEAHGKGCGGWFASGVYRRSERQLELHFRFSLGMVTYHIGKDHLDHETYMRFAGAHGQNRYPDFSKEPLESFLHLAHDIRMYGSDFPAADGLQFHAWVRDFKQNSRRFRRLNALP